MFGKLLSIMLSIYGIVWLATTCVFWYLANSCLGRGKLSNFWGALYIGLCWPAVLVTLLYYVIKGIPETREERGTIPVQ